MKRNLPPWFGWMELFTVVGLTVGLTLVAVAGVLSCTETGEASDVTLPYRAVIPGLARDGEEPVAVNPVIDAIYAQLPAEFPALDEQGWPMHALTGAITWARIGETARATEWADAFWALREPESGLWVNQMGYIDMANPYFATVLFELVGQHERAVETSHNVIAWSRAHPTGGYNPHFFAALSAAVIGEPMPEDIVALVQPGFEGRYGALEGMEEITPKGRYYADIMLAHWRAWGGPDMPYLAEETEYCPTLSASAECVGFYRWARGETYVPDLAGEPYGFWNDGVIFYSIPGFGRVR